MTLALTVAIWGRLWGQIMVAIMFPPKAGRVCNRSRFSVSIAKPRAVSRQSGPDLSSYFGNKGPAYGGSSGQNDFRPVGSDDPGQAFSVKIIGEAFQRRVIDYINPIGPIFNQAAGGRNPLSPARPPKEIL